MVNQQLLDYIKQQLQQGASNTVRLLSLSGEVQKALGERKISEGHARVILTVDNFLKQQIGKKEYDTVGEVFEVINAIPEFVEAIKGKAGPAIVVGSEKSRAGKVLVSFTGGTNPSKELYIELAKAGVGTLVEMHVPEDAMTELKKLHINVIDCGHMAADSIGANLFLDELEKQGVEVIVCSGIARVIRSKARRA